MTSVSCGLSLPGEEEYSESESYEATRLMLFEFLDPCRKRRKKRPTTLRRPPSRPVEKVMASGKNLEQAETEHHLVRQGPTTSNSMVNLQNSRRFISLMTAQTSQASSEFGSQA